MQNITEANKDTIQQNEESNPNSIEDIDIYSHSFDERVENFKNKAKDIYITEDLNFYELVMNLQKPSVTQPYISVHEGALEMYYGSSVQLKTGEGKTFGIIAAALALFLKTKKKVYIVVTNPYFVKNNSDLCINRLELFQKLTGRTLNIRVGFVLQTMNIYEKEIAYKNNDIIYLTPASLCFDFLENILQKDPKNVYKIQFENLLIDEIDAVLVDDAENPHILQTPDQISSIFGIKPTTFYGIIQEIYKSVIPTFTKDIHYTVDREIVTLTQRGWKLVNNTLDAYPESHHPGIIWIITSCLNVISRYKENEDYLIIDNKVNLLQPDTGRLYNNRQLGEGMHMVLEAINGLPPSHSSNCTLKINLLQIVPMFRHVAGCSGSIISVKEQLMINYGINCIEIESMYRNRVIKKTPKLFWNEEEQLINIYLEVKKIKNNNTLKSILIITSNIDLANKISSILYEYDDNMSLIFARNTEEMESVVDKSSQPGHITIATSILGRGVNIELQEKQYGSVLINTNLYYNDRTQIQVDGRVGRSGAPGVINYFYSLDDPLIQEKQELKDFVGMTHKKENPIIRAQRFLTLLKRQTYIQNEMKLKREKEVQFVMEEITPILVDLYSVKQNVNISENNYLNKLFQKIELDMGDSENMHIQFIYRNHKNKVKDPYIYISKEFVNYFYEDVTQLYRYIIDTHEFFEFSSRFISWINVKPAQYFRSILKEQISTNLYAKCYNILVEYLLSKN